MSKILVADDEARIRRLVCDFLRSSGYETEEAKNGLEAVEKFSTSKPFDLVICDIMMPGLDGWEVCKKIRKTSNVPIIVLTARTMEFDELASFESGADDFITKPFSPTILVKRVQALLRRAEHNSAENDPDILKCDGLILNKAAHSVTLDGTELDLKSKEFGILRKLLENPDRIFSRDALLDSVWGIDFEGDSRTVDSHLARLRTKLGTWGEKHLKTVFGAGYKIEVNKP